MVTYTIDVADTGQTSYTQARVVLDPRGLFDDADYNDDAQLSRGALVPQGDGTVLWTLDLAPGDTARATVSVTVKDPDPGDRSLRVAVTSDAAGSTCPPASTAAGCRSSVPVLVPGLSITSTADSSSVVAGGVVTYTIRATDTGETDYPEAALSDDLDALLPYGVYANDATATAGELLSSGGTLSWSGPLARGDAVLITFSVRVGVEAPDTTVLTNRVVSTSAGSTCLADSADPGCVTSTSIAARSITLSDATPSFTLTGLPGSTVEQEGAVGMKVTTNSPGGYAVTVDARTGTLVGTRRSSDTFPIGQLSVRGTAPNPFVRMSTTPVTVHTSTGPTSPDGDVIRNDYEVEIPDVASDTYSADLEYVVTAQ
ncbi:MAG: hypothetical protein ACRYG2_33475 [Janthinobacterium lividum]